MFFLTTKKAAQGACLQMGARKFYDLMISDALQEQARGKVTDPDQIYSLRDYMQVSLYFFVCFKSLNYLKTCFKKYTSTIDDLPAYMGGRSNSWRRLNLSG